jgi:hypothetical protein
LARCLIPIRLFLSNPISGSDVGDHVSFKHVCSFARRRSARPERESN